MRWLVFDWFLVNNRFDSANLGGCPVFFLVILVLGWACRACYLSSCELCAAASWKMHGDILLKKHGGRSSAGPPVSRYYPCFLLPSRRLSLFTKKPLTQSTAGGGVRLPKTGEEVGTNCAVNAIISGLHIERHQGHQQERVVCFAMLRGPPFNAFPRAALKTRRRSPEIGKQYSQ